MWLLPVITALKTLKCEDEELEASLGYTEEHLSLSLLPTPPLPPK